jgi:hypothetical protein
MIKCPYCGREFDVQALTTSGNPVQAEVKTKWYFTTYWVVIAFLCVGPLALPLVWFNPRYKPITKWVITVLAIFITIWLCIKSVAMYQNLMQQLKGLNSGY